VRKARFLASAYADLDDILTHLARTSGSASIALSFVTRLQQRCDELASLTGRLGRARPELRPDLRSIAYRGYVIFFRYLGTDLEVVHILEGHRDIDTFFDHEDRPLDRGPDA
jgi:plasmid stabilization system protein ParE